MRLGALQLSFLFDYWLDICSTLLTASVLLYAVSTSPLTSVVGASEFIGKPAKLEDLLRTLSQLIGSA